MKIYGLPLLAIEADGLTVGETLPGLASDQQPIAPDFSPQSAPKQTRCIHQPGIAVAMGQSNQRAEFERSIDEQLDTVTRLAIRLTGNLDSAEELVQETMLRAAANWQSFRQHASFKTWLYRILINAFRDRLRRKTKLEFEALPTDQCLDHSASAAAITEASELAELVARSIQVLPPRQREVLVLTTYESLTSQQIAETLGITMANVHSNLSIARRTLKQQLSRYLEMP